MSEQEQEQAYARLKSEVNELYEKMMDMHTARRRDAVYANLRKAYMEKSHELQRFIENHPKFQQK